MAEAVPAVFPCPAVSWQYWGLYVHDKYSSVQPLLPGGHRECSWWHQASCMLKTAIAEAQEGMCCQVFFLFHAMNKMPAAEIKLILLCEWELGVHSLWSCSFCRALKSDTRSWGTLSLHTPALDTGVPLNTLNISSEYPESLSTSLLVMVMPLSAPRRWGSEKSAESWPFSVLRCTEKGSAYWLYHPSVVLLTRDISANNKSRSLACQNPLFTTSSFKKNRIILDPFLKIPLPEGELAFSVFRNVQQMRLILCRFSYDQKKTQKAIHYFCLLWKSRTVISDSCMSSC